MKKQKTTEKASTLKSQLFHKSHTHGHIQFDRAAEAISINGNFLVLLLVSRRRNPDSGDDLVTVDFSPPTSLLDILAL